MNAFMVFLYNTCMIRITKSTYVRVCLVMNLELLNHQSQVWLVWPIMYKTN